MDIVFTQNLIGISEKQARLVRKEGESALGAPRRGTLTRFVF